MKLLQRALSRPQQPDKKLNVTAAIAPAGFERWHRLSAEEEEGSKPGVGVDRGGGVGRVMIAGP